jgi:hypothetical protein
MLLNVKITGIRSLKVVTRHALAMAAAATATVMVH